jgi:glycosyltransferase involved in cell wall biosynthesis
MESPNTASESSERSPASTTERPLRILLVGHACSPLLGSEPGFTWNWAFHLASHHEVWVLTHPQFRGDVEQFLEDHPTPGLHFEWVNLPTYRDPWDPAEGEKGIRPHYLLWQRAALNKARELHRNSAFDLVHHVSWGTVSAPPALWKLPIPLVWGPVGGGQTTPTRFLSHFGRARLHELGRTVRVWFLPALPNVRRAARNSQFISATNIETATVLRRSGARQVEIIPDSGLSSDLFRAATATRARGEHVQILWAGRLEHRKGLSLALDSFRRTPPRCRLTVAGRGPLLDHARAEAARLGVAERVAWLGEVPRTEMSDLFNSSDIFLFTSLRDSFGSVVLDAMAHALPVVTLDHQGVGTLLPSQASIRVPVTDPEDVAGQLGAALAELAGSPERREAMGREARLWAAGQTWERRAAEMTDRYHEILRARRPGAAATTSGP